MCLFSSHCFSTSFFFQSLTTKWLSIGYCVDSFFLCPAFPVALRKRFSDLPCRMLFIDCSVSVPSDYISLSAHLIYRTNNSINCEFTYIALNLHFCIVFICSFAFSLPRARFFSTWHSHVPVPLSRRPSGLFVHSHWRYARNFVLLEYNGILLNCWKVLQSHWCRTILVYVNMEMVLTCCDQCDRRQPGYKNAVAYDEPDFSPDNSFIDLLG